MATKRQIVSRIFELTESEQNRQKLKDNYYWMLFLGLNYDYSQAKYSMAIDYNKFSGYEYKRLLDEVEKALAQ